ncbi:MAG: flagellar biosynthetic protein FliO [Candidatus Sulfotelmatobacter sp.]|jgi:flagellar biogenesis protein FliO
MTAETLRMSAGGFRMRGAALWERVLRLGRRAPRRLRLCESLPLGDRRFVAVVEFDRERFLLGGTPSSLVLLSRLEQAGAQARDEVQDVSRSSETSSNWRPRQRGEKC